jgi:hypothetical protein
MVDSNNRMIREIADASQIIEHTKKRADIPAWKSRETGG